MKQRTRFDELRESLRMQQSYNTITRYGVDIALDRGMMGTIRRFFVELLYDVPQPARALPVPAKVRLMLQEMGPIYVKVGQLVSSQAQALPDEWSTELDKLQSSVRPFPYDEVEDIIQTQFGAPPEEIFATFNQEPLAAASLGQVHRATLQNGQEVVVKVQRPYIRDQVKADVGIMDWLARLVARRTQLAREIDLVNIVDEFGSQVLTELDYRGEAYNMFRLDQNLQEIPDVRLPIVYEDLSTATVLTMEFIDGIKITDIDAIRAAGIDPQTLAENAIRATIKQILIDGLFHGDLHPGNVLVNRSDGNIVYLDVGMMGELTLRQRANMINMIMVLQQGDVRGLSQAMRSLSKPFREVNDKAYERDFDRRMGRMVGKTGIPFAETLNEVLSVLRDNGLQLDPELTLAAKSLMQMESISKALIPEGQMMTIAMPMLLEQVQAQITTENITNAIKKEATYTLREVAQRIPNLQEATLKWLGQYEKGRLEIYHDTSGLDKPLHDAGRLVRQVIVGILLMGIIIGSAIATGIAAAYNIGATYSDLFATIAFVGYVSASLLAIGIVIALVWSLLRD